EARSFGATDNAVAPQDDGRSSDFDRGRDPSGRRLDAGGNVILSEAKDLLTATVGEARSFGAPDDAVAPQDDGRSSDSDRGRDPSGRRLDAGGIRHPERSE